MDDQDGYFGEDVAASYDDGFEGHFDPAVIDVTAGALAGLAGGGRALEFAIGTGRVALPLAARGVEVHGIDLSRAMVAPAAGQAGRLLRGRGGRARAAAAAARSERTRTTSR